MDEDANNLTVGTVYVYVNNELVNASAVNPVDGNTTVGIGPFSQGSYNLVVIYVNGGKYRVGAGAGIFNVTDVIHTGNDTQDIQDAIDNAIPGTSVDLGDANYYNVAGIIIDKDITITGGNITGDGSKTPIFTIVPKSEGGPSEVNITGVNFFLNNGES